MVLDFLERVFCIESSFVERHPEIAQDKILIGAQLHNLSIDSSECFFQAVDVISLFASSTHIDLKHEERFQHLKICECFTTVVLERKNLCSIFLMFNLEEGDL